MRKAWSRISKKVDSDKEEQIRQEPLERGDLAAMLLAAAGTIFLPVMLILLVLGGLCYFLFAIL